MIVTIKNSLENAFFGARFFRRARLRRSLSDPRGQLGLRGRWPGWQRDVARSNRAEHGRKMVSSQP